MDSKEHKKPASGTSGSRQREGLSDADDWIDLPPGSFEESGTNVNAANVIYNTDDFVLTA